MVASDIHSSDGRSAISRDRVRSKSWTSWKVWLPLLLVGLGAIAAAIGFPIYRRMQAIRYLEARRCPVDFTDDSEWLTERFGEVGTALRRIERISCRVEFSDEVLHRVALLGDVPQLECEGLFTAPLEQDGLHAIKSLSHLEDLYLDGFFKSDTELRAFCESPSPLRSVFLANSAVSADTFAALTRKETIRSLKLVGGRVSIDWHRLQPMLQLEEFSLWSRDRIDMRWLLQSTRLRDLELDCLLSDEDLAQIAELRELRALMIIHLPREHGVTEAGIAHLTRLPHLRSLGLPEELLTQECLESLRQMPSLTYLISSHYISDDEVRAAASREWELAELGH